MSTTARGDMPARRWAVGVAVGKFNPPHRGHVHLLATGADQVDHLHVLLGDRSDQTIPATDRAAWLADALPANVTINITPDDLPADNVAWARRALALLPTRPGVAFTSEAWGPGWAAQMGAEHVAVDPERSSVPISATAIRADLVGHFSWLVPAARASLARRIVLVGAESTGKTTLARALARSLQTVWVPEHGRWYWEGRRYLTDQSWSTEEFRRIARVQAQLADDLARQASGGVVIADTDALVTAVWHRRYTGVDDAALDQIAGDHRPDHYLICAPDIPWQQDGTRESSDQRHAMHTETRRRVGDSGVGWTLLAGPRDQRLHDALTVVTEVATRLPLT